MSTNQEKATLPKQGISRTEVLRMMEEFRNEDARWHDGKTWSLVYHAGDEHSAFLKKAHGLFFSENGLHPGAFPSLRRFEAEVVSMSAQLLGGNENTTGTMTSGGTESIMMAIKTYRDYARATRPDVTAPEMVLPVSVHPAFSKAAHYFGVKPVYTPVGEDFRADLAAAKKAINSNTILVVGSAPSYPQGVVDPIQDLAALAKEHGLPCHVDACLGGFMLPWVKKLGHDIPPFDFSVPGVTSISADLHKYGFTAKGASVILYASRELRLHQFFVRTDWPGGLFGSPSFCGTRPGGPIAAAWAALKAFGEDGYLEMAKKIMETTRGLQKAVELVPSLKILGKPNMSVFAFNSTQYDIYAVADQMQARGWFMDRQLDPACLHLMVTPAHADVVEKFGNDLRESVGYVAEHPEASNEGMAAMYGMMAKIPDPKMAHQYILNYLDQVYQ